MIKQLVSNTWTHISANFIFSFIQFLLLIYALSQRDYQYDFGLLGRATVVLRTTSNDRKKENKCQNEVRRKCRGNVKSLWKPRRN